MSAQYKELFLELYNHKYIDNKPYQNAIQRIQQMQKNMKQEKMLKKIPDYIQAPPEHLPNLQNLQVIHDDVPKRIVRTMLPKKKKKPFKTNQFSQENVQSERKSQDENVTTHIYLRQNRKIPQYRSYTHRVRENVSPLQNYGEQKFSLQYQSALKARTQGRKKYDRKSLSTHNDKRAMTPSKRVIIGGRNLEEQAEGYQKDFLKFDEELEKYQKTLNERNYEIRRKSIRSQKQSRQQKARESIRGKKAFRVSRKLEKEENVELQPWSVMAQHQFY